MIWHFGRLTFGLILILWKTVYVVQVRYNNNINNNNNNNVINIIIINITNKGPIILKLQDEVEGYMDSKENELTSFPRDHTLSSLLYVYRLCLKQSFCNNKKKPAEGLKLFTIFNHA